VTAPLHLLEVGVHWPPETFLRRKLEGLAASGMRVTVASQMVHDGDAKLEGVELVRVPWHGSAGEAAREAVALAIRAPGRLVRVAWRVARASSALRRRHGRTGLLAMYLRLARLRPDVVQFEWNTAAVDHLPLFDVWGCPVLTACRGSDVSVYPHAEERGHYAAQLPEVMRRASAVHCVSQAMLREAAQFGLPRDKATVIRPAVDVAAFRPAVNGRDEEVFRVVSVGQLRWEKGHEYALQAVRTLADQGVPVRFELLGGDPGAGVTARGERERILHTVADLGLEDHVSLAGQFSSPEIGRRLAAADVLLHASLAEGIPNVVLEAMACAVPVVTTNSGGVSEVITHGVEGIVVPPRDPEQLAVALLRLWRDPGLARSLGEAGRARAEAFAPERHIEQFLELYRKAASSPARA
jgi:colanic acid/amylovoran biosynthesis glycosyltransferase